MMTSRMKRRLKREFSNSRPTVWVGKEGATPQILNEVSRQLEQHEVVKGRILQMALKDADAKELSEKIAKETESMMVEVRGHTFILYRKRRKSKPSPLKH